MDITKKVKLGTKEDLNEFGQILGNPVSNFQPPDVKKFVSTEIRGKSCFLQLLNPKVHFEELYKSYSKDDGSMWTYLFGAPFKNYDEFEQHYLKLMNSLQEDAIFYCILSKVDTKEYKPVGIAAYLAIKPEAGSVEIGHLAFSPDLRKTTASTEALFLMMKLCFELGFRRCEWKCNSLNQNSAAAAVRLGFQYEGLFRQANVIKGRNRDTKWFSIIDSEWPQRLYCFEKWLDDSNFDQVGNQVHNLKYFENQLKE